MVSRQNRWSSYSVTVEAQVERVVVHGAAERSGDPDPALVDVNAHARPFSTRLGMFALGCPDYAFRYPSVGSSAQTLSTSYRGGGRVGCMTDNHANDDLKAKMREALDRKKGNDRGVPADGPAKEKAHGSEVVGGAPKMHRRKAGGGGS